MKHIIHDPEEVYLQHQEEWNEGKFDLRPVMGCLIDNNNFIIGTKINLINNNEVHLPNAQNKNDLNMTYDNVQAEMRF